MSWLTAVVAETPFPPAQMFWRIAAAAVFGGAVGLIYKLSHGRLKHDARAMIATLVLLAMLIAMVSMVIGDNVARAFSLVGALSIVRFRTVVEDTRDTAFVIFAVIVGMACGANILLLPLIGVPLVGAAAIVLSVSPKDRAAGGSPEGRLLVRLGLGRDPELFLRPVLERHAITSRLTGAATARQGSALDLEYLIRLQSPDTAARLASELNTLEGVQHVEIKL